MNLHDKLAAAQANQPTPQEELDKQKEVYDDLLAQVKGCYLVFGEAIKAVFDLDEKAKVRPDYDYSQFDVQAATELLQLYKQLGDKLAPPAPAEESTKPRLTLKRDKPAATSKPPEPKRKPKVRDWLNKLP